MCGMPCAVRRDGDLVAGVRGLGAARREQREERRGGHGEPDARTWRVQARRSVCWRSGAISTTFQARRAALHRAGSRRRWGPPRTSAGRGAAERGKAWWLWCQDSPIESTDSQNTLVEWSSTAKRRVPKKWQTELIDHVTWCSRKIRDGAAPQRGDERAAERARRSRSRARTGSRCRAATHSENSRVDARACRGPRAGRARSGRGRPGRRGRTASPCAAYQRPLTAPLRPAAVAVRRVRVALLVGVRVVLAVVGDPRHHRPLDGHRAEDGQRVLRGLVGLEGAVREQAVEAERDAERGQHVHRGHDRQVGPADPLRVPQQRRSAATRPANGQRHARRGSRPCAPATCLAGWRANRRVSCAFPRLGRGFVAS